MNDLDDAHLRPLRAVQFVGLPPYYAEPHSELLLLRLVLWAKQLPALLIWTAQIVKSSRS
jgi:hypothetical protein